MEQIDLIKYNQVICLLAELGEFDALDGVLMDMIVSEMPVKIVAVLRYSSRFKKSLHYDSLVEEAKDQLTELGEDYKSLLEGIV